eukprot:509763-Prorocentrum_minimum.AAC.2
MGQGAASLRYAPASPRCAASSTPSKYNAYPASPATGRTGPRIGMSTATVASGEGMPPSCAMYAKASYGVPSAFTSGA